MRKKAKKSRIIFVFLIIAILFGILVGNFMSKPIVCIDAGHGGNDVGAILESENRYEKDDTLNVALLVKEKLENQGVIVILTRNNDTYVSLEKRAQKANFLKADLFVSIHRNSAKSGDGVEIWIGSEKNEESEQLANNILQNLDKNKIQTNRGVKAGTIENSNKDYYVNKYTNMPSCLIELGFISNKTDNKLFDSNIDAYAESITNGILKSIEKTNKR